MEMLTDFFSIETTLVTLFGYDLSWLEFSGTVLNILCVWLIAKKNILTWPIGILAVVLFAVLFYQIQLYSDFVEQIYFFITGIYGWWLWDRMRKRGDANDEDGLRPLVLTPRGRLWTVLIVGVGTLAMGLFVGNIHTIFPVLFPLAAVFPFLDAFTTVMSFTAQLLMAHKRIESWVLWIVVDIIGIGLYFARGVVFVSGLYGVFLVLASKGLYDWYKAYRDVQEPEAERLPTGAVLEAA